MEPIIGITKQGELVCNHNGMITFWNSYKGDEPFDKERALELLCEALYDDSFEFRDEIVGGQE